jgi:hypothetical protein
VWPSSRWRAHQSRRFIRWGLASTFVDLVRSDWSIVIISCLTDRLVALASIK